MPPSDLAYQWVIDGAPRRGERQCDVNDLAHGWAATRAELDVVLPARFYATPGARRVRVYYHGRLIGYRWPRGLRPEVPRAR